MSEPIYKIAIVRFTPRWYQMSPDEQNEWIAKTGEVFAKNNGKSLLTCFSGWSTEEWMSFSFETFPNVEAVQGHTNDLFELGWYQFLVGKTILGTALQPYQPAEMSDPIYKLWLYKLSEAGYQLPQEELETLTAPIFKSLEGVGAKRIIECDSSWASEQWTRFGITAFPNIEALQTHQKTLNEINQLRYVESRSLLGTEWVPE